jgi:hypothetical protein
MSSRKRTKSKSNHITVTGGGGGGSDFTDDFSIGINAADTNATPTDAVGYEMTLDLEDTNATPTDAASLTFPTGVWGDTNSTPTEAREFLIMTWLNNSAGSGVSNPSNANGSDDGASAVVSTAPAGSTTETLTSDVGNNVSVIAFTKATYRGWFRARTSLGTSTAELIAHSNGGLFADIVMFTLSGIGGDVNHLTGSFTFDLGAAGINTIAKLQTLQIYHRTTDAVAGVTPAIIDVDAGSIDLTTTL